MSTDTHQPHEVDYHDRGLQFDMATMSRRKALLWAAGGLTTLALAGCGSGDDGPATTTSGGTTTTAGTTTAGTTTPGTSTGDASVAEIAGETAGPFPGDGSNGPNVLSESGVVRRDMTSSFGSLNGTAEGVPLTVNLTLLDVSEGGVPLAGAAVYLWHCDRDGGYSLYSDGVTDQNYLRGVQESDADGKLSFTTIFPGCYPGRWPHMHFEVYPSLADATSSGSKLVTSQLAFPKDSCEEVYASSGYEQSVRSLAELSLETDGVFRDGFSTQLAKMSGSVAGGLTASLNVGV